jgi:hypothetical protein
MKNKTRKSGYFLKKPTKNFCLSEPRIMKPVQLLLCSLLQKIVCLPGFHKSISQPASATLR